MFNKLLSQALTHDAYDFSREKIQIIVERSTSIHNTFFERRAPKLCKLRFASSGKIPREGRQKSCQNCTANFVPERILKI